MNQDKENSIVIEETVRFNGIDKKFEKLAKEYAKLKKNDREGYEVKLYKKENGFVVKTFKIIENVELEDDEE